MRPMKRSTVGQPSVSGAPRADPTKTDAAERTLLIGHTKLPGLGSGPIFPFSWMRQFFRRTGTHASR